MNHKSADFSMPNTTFERPPTSIDCRLEEEHDYVGGKRSMSPGGRLQANSGEAQESIDRARDILEGMRKKRCSLEQMGHSISSISSSHEDDEGPRKPSPVARLWTVDENEMTSGTSQTNTQELHETDRARDILERMRKRRESFSKLLVASPTPTKHSLTRTESTAAISWVSSSTRSTATENEGVTFIYSEEEASAKGYDDYAYHASDVDSVSTRRSYYTSSTGSTAGVSFFGGYDSSSSRSLISDISFQNSVMQALDNIRNYDMRYTGVPNPLTGVPLDIELSSPERRQVLLERKTTGTSRARNLYHERTKGKLQNYQYLKSEGAIGHGSVTSRLRADLAAISERRTMLATMLDSVKELKSQEIDFSVVASTILSASSNPKQETSPEQLLRKMQPTEMAESGRHDRSIYDRSPKRHARKTAPVEYVDFGGENGWSANDARAEERIEPFGFPLSDVKWAASDDDSASFESGDDDIEWDADEKLDSLIREDSVRGSLFVSEASSTEASSDASLPLQIEFKVKNTPLSEAASEPPQALRSAEFLKALYSPRPEEAILTAQESRYGGIYQIAQRTQDVERLTGVRASTKRKKKLDRDDFNIPYNVEDRFAGGLYHISQQTVPMVPTNRAMI